MSDDVSSVGFNPYSEMINIIHDIRENNNKVRGCQKELELLREFSKEYQQSKVPQISPDKLDLKLRPLANYVNNGVEQILQNNCKGDERIKAKLMTDMSFTNNIKGMIAKKINDRMEDIKDEMFWLGNDTKALKTEQSSVNTALDIALTAPYKYEFVSILPT